MALHTDKRGFVYETWRENGRVCRRYVGKAARKTVAVALELDATGRALTANEREQRTREEEQRQEDARQLTATVARLDDQTSALVASVLAAVGYHRARGQWRKQNTMTKAIEKERALQVRAQNGDIEAARELWLQVDGDPAQRAELVKQTGNMAAISLNLLVARITDGDMVKVGGIRRQLDAMRDELSGPNPSALERPLVERVLVCWLQLHYFEASYVVSLGSDTMKQSEFREKQVNGANKRYLASIKALAQIRKLQLPTLQINLAEKQVNIGQLTGRE